MIDKVSNPVKYTNLYIQITDDLKVRRCRPKTALCYNNRSRENRKVEIISFYNFTKDAVDEVCGTYSVSRLSCRLPLHKYRGLSNLIHGKPSKLSSTTCILILASTDESIVKLLHRPLTLLTNITTSSVL